MDTQTVAVEAEVEATHWWFVQRRNLFAAEIDRLGLSRQAAILDVGTGTGANLRLLGRLGYTNVAGIDPSPDAIRFCAEKGLGNVTQGSACAIPFPDATFDLVMATDVIEHIDDDALALREAARVLRPSGILLLTVPTFQSLWGVQDDRSHHKRRYRIEQLLERVEQTPLDVERSYYFNYLLFVPILLARRLMRMASINPSSENEINTPLINRILNGVFRADVATAPYLRPPFGVSALAIARKPAKA
ncbi:MAG: class I SAM-dependent methyltransferase [Rhodopseudomonas palustris]|uniref:Class I SAM-dependent methyltransferase n=1 Tax=Rhodopseudomonas palustris TaxID=1076 RepID=A0A933S209_RHOPL|nr:class I SAM-dependent methyltransferase [Rhodopseudomonas palustris]